MLLARIGKDVVITFNSADTVTLKGVGPVAKFWRSQLVRHVGRLCRLWFRGGA